MLFLWDRPLGRNRRLTFCASKLTLARLGDLITVGLAYGRELSMRIIRAFLQGSIIAAALASVANAAIQLDSAEITAGQVQISGRSDARGDPIFWEGQETGFQVRCECSELGLAGQCP